MALRYSFDLIEEADRLDRAIANVLASGIRTKDIAAPGANAVGTQDVGDAIVKELEAHSLEPEGALPRRTRRVHVERDRRERVAGADERPVDGIGQNPCAAETFAVVPRRHDHGRGLPGGRIAVHRADRHHIAGVEEAAGLNPQHERPILSLGAATDRAEQAASETSV